MEHHLLALLQLHLHSRLNTCHLASMDLAKATARRDEKHLSFGIWCTKYYLYIIIIEVWQYTTFKWFLSKDMAVEIHSHGGLVLNHYKTNLVNSMAAESTTHTRYLQSAFPPANLNFLLGGPGEPELPGLGDDFMTHKLRKERTTDSHLTYRGCKIYQLIIMQHESIYRWVWVQGSR